MMISRSCGSKYNHKYDFPNRVSAIIKINNVQHFKLAGDIVMRMKQILMIFQLSDITDFVTDSGSR